MPVRLGVELSPVSCRFVELDSSPASAAAESPAQSPFVRRACHAEVPARATSWRRSGGSPPPPSCGGCRRTIATPWSRTVHSARMRRDAVAAMQGGGVETRGRVADIFAAPPREGSAHAFGGRGARVDTGPRGRDAMAGGPGRSRAIDRDARACADVAREAAPGVLGARSNRSLRGARRDNDRRGAGEERSAAGGQRAGMGLSG